MSRDGMMGLAEGVYVDEIRWCAVVNDHVRGKYLDAKTLSDTRGEAEEKGKERAGSFFVEAVQVRYHLEIREHHTVRFG